MQMLDKLLVLTVMYHRFVSGSEDVSAKPTHCSIDALSVTENRETIDSITNLNAHFKEK